LRELTHIARLEIHGPDVGFPVGAVGVFHEPVEDKRAAVGRDVEPGCTHTGDEASAHVPVTACELPGRATVGGDAEEVVVPVRQKADAVKPIVDPVDDLGRGCPFCSGGWGREIDGEFLLAGHHPLEVEVSSVGRPLMVRGILRLVGHLAHGALRVHPPDVELRAPGLTFCQIRDPSPIGGPTRRRPVHQESVLGPVGVHDPDRGLEAVFQLVDVGSRVDDLLPIRGDLRIAHPLDIQVVSDGEERV
jgi:hypothetical protein